MNVRERFKRINEWVANHLPDDEPDLPPTDMHRVADSISTLAWCIFWGLILNGCIGHGINISMLPK